MPNDLAKKEPKLVEEAEERFVHRAIVVGTQRIGLLDEAVRG